MRLMLICMHDGPRLQMAQDFRSESRARVQRICIFHPHAHLMGWDGRGVGRGFQKHFQIGFPAREIGRRAGAHCIAVGFTDLLLLSWLLVVTAPVARCSHIGTHCSLIIQSLCALATDDGIFFWLGFLFSVRPGEHVSYVTYRERAVCLIVLMHWHVAVVQRYVTTHLLYYSTSPQSMNIAIVCSIDARY